MVSRIRQAWNSCNLPKSNILSYLRIFFLRILSRKDYYELNRELLGQYQLQPNALNLHHLIGIGLGGTIGTGIYTLGGQAAGRYAGPSVILSFLLGGFLALLSSLSFSELSSIMASPGSAYTYAYVALGEYVAFLVGWSYMIFYQLAASTVAVGWSANVVHLIDLMSDHNATRLIVQAPAAWSENTDSFYVTGQVINLPAIAITVAVTIILFIGIRETANINLGLVIFKIIVLLIFIFAGCVYVDPKNYQPFFPRNEGSFKSFGFSGMLTGVSHVFFAYVGFESVSTVSKEARHTTRYTPIGTIVTMIVTICIYIGVSTVMVGLAPYQDLNTSNPLTVAIGKTPYGLWLLIVLNLGGIASRATVAINVLLAQIRIFQAMGNDKLLPAILNRVHKKRKTPWVATLISGTFCALLSGFCPVDIIGEAASLAGLIIYFIVHICVIVIRYKNPEVKRPFSLPFGPWLIPTVGAILCLLLMILMSKGTAIRYAIWMAIGQFVYFGYSFRKSKLRRQMRSGSFDSTAAIMPMPPIKPADATTQPEPSDLAPSEQPGLEPIPEENEESF